MNVGSIVFGPNNLIPNPNSASGYSVRGLSINADANVRACNCMGPQPGETKCPCMLAAEMTKAQAMIRDGVTIGGVRYKLVREGDFGAKKPQI